MKVHSKELSALLEEIDSKLADLVDKIETLIPELEKDSDAFIADDIYYASESIRGDINEDA